MRDDSSDGGARAGGRPSSLRLFLVLGAVTVVGPASMDIYLPALPELSRDFGVQPSTAQLTITAFFVGLGIGQVVGGPLSDVHGRRAPLVGGFVVFTLATLACAAAPNLAVLAFLRVVQGTTASFGFVIGRAVVRDVYAGAAASHFLSRLMLVVGLGPIVAPILGAQILRVTSWRGVFVALAVLGVVLVAVSALLLPETLPPERRRPAGLRATGSTMAGLARDRGFVALVLVAAFGGAAMLAYIVGSSFVFQDVYGVSPQVYSVLFALNAVFLILGAQVNAHLLGHRSPRRLLGLGVGAIAVAAIALVVAVAVFRDLGVAGVLVPVSAIAFCWTFVQANAVALALTDHPREAGTAAALFGVVMYALGAVVAPLVGIDGRESAVPMAVSILVCAGAAVVALRAVPAGARSVQLQLGGESAPAGTGPPPV